MKKHSAFFIRMISFLLIYPGILMAQIPQGFNYQAVARDGEGEPLAFQNLTVHLLLHEGSTSGVVTWEEFHDVTTSSSGLFTLIIGGPDAYGTAGSSETFDQIDWSTGAFFLEIKAGPNQGSLTDLGISQLFAVPFALYSAQTNDPDQDPNNEIQDLQLINNILTITNNADATEIDLAPFQGTNTDNQTLSLASTTLSITGGNSIDLSPLRDGTEDADADPTNELQTLSIIGSDISISDGNTITLPPDQVNDSDSDPLNEIQDLSFDGSELIITGNASATPVELGTFVNKSVGWVRDQETVSYAEGRVGVGTALPGGRLSVQGVDESAEVPLFEVRRKDGYPVFAVYEDGVWVYTDTVESKGIKGGFAVGGYNSSKAAVEEYLRITPDSVRIYINQDETKGIKGGFAVGGYNSGKSNTSEYLRVTTDSTRIYVDQDAKGTTGGFAVSSRISSTGPATSFMNITPENYFIGHESGINMDGGQFNSFLGYKSGYNTTSGSRNYFIGYISGYHNTTGYSNIFIGDSAGFNNSSGYYNTFIGNWTGFKNSTGYKNFFAGYRTGYSNTTGICNVFIGPDAGGKNTTAWYNTFVGIGAGGNTTTGGYNSYYGINSGFAMKSGVNNAFFGSNSGYWFDGGSGNTFLGAEAGRGGPDDDPADPAGNYNTIVGSFSATVLENASNNVFIGAFSGGAMRTGTGNVFIGYQAGSAETGSNKLFINNASGNSAAALIYGEFDTDLLRLNASVGIGMAPTEKLDVNGGVRIGNSALTNTGTIRWTGTDFEGYTSAGWKSFTESAPSPWSISGDVLYTLPAGPVAIGTNEPNSEAALHILGEPTLTTVIIAPNEEMTDGSSEIQLAEDKLFKSGISIKYDGPADRLFFTGYRDGTPVINPITIINSESHPFVGINETDPKEALTVKGNIFLSGSILYAKSGDEKPDFVFQDTYHAMTTAEVDDFISRNGYLPWITPASAEPNAINMSSLTLESLEAIENLQLQVITLKKENDGLRAGEQELRSELEQLKKQVELILSEHSR